MPDDSPVLVAGATGFVGRRLTEALVRDGHDVRAMTRRPEEYTGVGTPVRGDAFEPASLREALSGCTAAYYLVHSLSSPDFERLDAEAARAFGEAAAEAGVAQIIYLGGLGDEADELSPHLRSRREVEELLGEGGVPVTVLRAGIIVGDQGLSWEITRQLVEHLPAMVTPRWVRTRTQPIAVDDVVGYLCGVLANEAALGRVFEVGGPEVLRYATMLQRVARIERRTLPILPVPLLSPRLSSLWLALVTDVDTVAGRHLVDSMTTEVVVRDESIRDVVPLELTPYDDAVRRALAERASRATAASPRQTGLAVATFVAGTGLLGASLRSEPGSRRFYALTFATAGAWLVGGAAATPRQQAEGESLTATSVAVPVATGLATFAVFGAGAVVVRRVKPLERAVDRALDFAERGSGPLVMLTTAVNGVGEEVFFRGALYDALPERSAVAGTTAAYTLATVATRNPAMVFAAAVMGSLFGHQRRASGGVRASLLTHLTWSALMVRLLPRIVHRRRRESLR